MKDNAGQWRTMQENAGQCGTGRDIAGLAGLCRTCAIQDSGRHCRMVLNRAESCRTVQHKFVLVYYVLGETVSLLLRSHKKVELTILGLSQDERQMAFAESYGAP